MAKDDNNVELALLRQRLETLEEQFGRIRERSDERDQLDGHWREQTTHLVQISENQEDSINKLWEHKVSKEIHDKEMKYLKIILLGGYIGLTGSFLAWILSMMAKIFGVIGQ